jgi:hypothetical protein
MIDLQSLAYLGEVIGAAAVVASLLYLALQVRQSSKAQRTENYAHALERVSAFQAVLSQDSDLSRIFAKGVWDTSELTGLEKIRFSWLLYEAFGSFEFMFHTYETNEIPEEVWKRWSQTVAWWLNFPGVQQWWMNRPVNFTESFTVFVESLIRDNPTDLQASQRWQQFVASSVKEPKSTQLAGTQSSESTRPAAEI